MPFLQRGQRVDLRHIRRPARDRGTDPVDLLLRQAATSGSIAGVMRSVPPSGTSRGGTATASCPAWAASSAGVGAANSARTGTARPCSRSRSASVTASSE